MTSRRAALLPFGNGSIGTVLLENAELAPDAPFLVFDQGDESTSYSYAEAVVLAQRGQAVLRSMGVATGDHFAIATRNRSEFFACWFGAALIGAVMVPASPGSSPDELAYVLDHARCGAVLVEAGNEALEAAARRGGAAVITTGADFAERASQALQPIQVRGVDPGAAMSIMYTSGTTSRPKGVVVTHANYLYAGESVAQNLRMRPDDRWLVVLPTFHANAQYYSIMSSLVTGASVAVMERFSASRWASQARTYNATLGSLFAAPIRMILAQPPGEAEHENRLRAVCFAQNLTQNELDEFERRFTAPLLQLYGMTETIAPPTMNPLFGRRNNLTIGRPVISTQLRVVTDDGREAGLGETGELLVQGDPGITLMAGYFNDSDATEETLKDGWLHTGDIVRLEAGGFLSFYDRARDIIKRGGEIVATAEVERVIAEHPAVRESAAVAVPDEMLDQALKVVVVRKLGQEVTEQDLIQHCRDRLSSFKVPSFIEFVDALPHTSVGKVRKADLRTVVHERDAASRSYADASEKEDPEGEP
ncbi:AMP-binding protein [Micromonospora sp. CPCC 206060]|uniref:class I adenylate-forming enzyme family protein n=1 Tax=Micromonospora sp. CPCC 206060 TaxID=3122406 RepID=UPI002FF1CB84